MASSNNSSSNNNATNTGATNNVQTNFNPSWMQQTQPSRPIGMSNYQPKMTDESEETPACDPIFAKHSYGREDLLAMIGKVGTKAPSGLEKCPFFLEKAHTPVVLLPATEIEMRLQQNINSSKALSAFNRTAQGGNSTGDGGTGSEMPVGNAPWTVVTTGPNRPAGIGTSLSGAQRKYQHENKPPNRWSALGAGSGGTAGAPPKQAWKNGQNAVTGPTDRAAFREKSTSLNQFERVGSVGGNKKAEKEGGHQQENNALISKPEPKVASAEKQPSPPHQQFKEQQQQQHKPAVTSASAVNIINKPEEVQDVRAVEQQMARLGHQEQPAQQLAQQPVVEKWHYLDPSGVQRGPFDSQQMQAWFASGYFTASLQVRREGDPSYITLGDLYLNNGKQDPFVVKQQQQQPSKSHNIHKPKQQQQQMVGAGQGMETTTSKVGASKVGPHRISPTELLNMSKPGGGATSSSALGLLDVDRIWATTPLEDIGGNDLNAGNSSQAAVTATMGLHTIPTGTGFTNPVFSRHLKEIEMEKVLQAKEVQIMEEQRKLLEKEELLRRDEQERAEKERRMLEMENELKRKQDELSRIACEKDSQFEKRCMQMAEYERKKREELAALEQRILSEQQRQQLRMEEEDRRRAQELKELLLREQERQRQLIEQESKRKREEEEARLRLAMQEAHHMKELALEQARRVEEEQRRRFIEEQQREQQRALEEARKERARQHEVTAKAEAAVKVEQQRIGHIPAQKQSQHGQAAHSANSHHTQKQQQPQSAAPPHYTAVEIGQQAQHQQQRSAWQPVPVNSVPLEMAIPEPQPPPVDTKAAQRLQQQQSVERRGWQQVAMPKPAPIPPVITKGPAGGSSSAGSKQQSGGGKEANKLEQQQKKAAKKTAEMKGQNKVEDKFTAWILKRVKELNSSVDAEVFANFIAQIDSPNEAEDYIIGYFGENKEVKDFYREFLNKRIELRPRVQHTRKDDLSRPAAALNTDAELAAKSGTFVSGTSAIGHAKAATAGAASSGHVQAGGNGSSAAAAAALAAANAARKKKQKKVLDPATLGFMAVSNPNRVNAGEIDSVPPVLPGATATNRKR